MPSPGSTHACPNSAACWSPAMPATGTAWPCSASAPGVADLAAAGHDRAAAPARGTPNRSQQLGVPAPARDVEQHRPRRVGGVGGQLAGELEDQPRVDRPEHRAAVAGRARAGPSTLSSSHSIFVPEKYGSSTSPVALAHRAPRGRPRAARRSGPRCGGPARRSRGAAARRWPGPRRTTVSRWLVIPTASSSPSRTPASASASPATAWVTRPDLGRVVLDPARAREVLLELAVGAADELAVQVEDQAGGAGRALVDGQDHGGRIRADHRITKATRAGQASVRPPRTAR